MKDEGKILLNLFIVVFWKLVASCRWNYSLGKLSTTLKMTTLQLYTQLRTMPDSRNDMHLSVIKINTYYHRFVRQYEQELSPEDSRFSSAACSLTHLDVCR
jgi:hypothetical protein